MVALAHGHHLTMGIATTYRPTRDSRRMRRFWRVQGGVGLTLILAGTAQALAGEIPWLGVANVVVGMVIVTGSMLIIPRVWVEIDDTGVRWRGQLRTDDVAWGSVEEVILDDRGCRWGSNVKITLRERNGTRREIPGDALAGLEEPVNVERRERLLDALTTYATEGGVTVRKAKLDGSTRHSLTRVEPRGAWQLIVEWAAGRFEWAVDAMATRMDCRCVRRR
jgi:hypothetical protein